MKAAVLLMAMFGMFYPTPPEGPATTPNPAYPVHVHIIIAKSSGGSGEFRGFGRGDIVGDTVQGFDYTFSCGEFFFNNQQPSEFYQAKWKKPNEKLEILLQKIGSNSTGHCDLNVSLKTKPYGVYSSAGTAIPAAGKGSTAPTVQEHNR